MTLEHGGTVQRLVRTLVAGGATVTLPADVLRGQHSVSARFVPDDEIVIMTRLYLLEMPSMNLVRLREVGVSL